MKKLTVIVMTIVYMSLCTVAIADSARTAEQIQLEMDAYMWRLSSATREMQEKLKAEQEKMMKEPSYVELQNKVHELRKELEQINRSKEDNKNESGLHRE